MPTFPVIPKLRALLAARAASSPPGNDDRARRNRRTSITAIDLDSGWLHAVQASLRGTEPRLSRHVAIPLPGAAADRPEDPASRAEAVARALKQARLDPGAVILGVPRSQAILRVLTLPPAQREPELAAMVYLQIRRDLPFPIEDAVVDFLVLPPGPPPPPSTGSSPRPAEPGANPSAPADAPASRVLVVVVRRETVEAHLQFARAAGLKLQALTLRPFAIGRAAARCAPEVARGCAAILSTQAGEVTFDVLVDGALVFSRVGTLPPRPEPASLPRTSDDPGDARFVEAAMLEASRSLHSYEGSPGHARVESFLVTGTTGAESAIARALADRFGIPARPLDAAAALADTTDEPVHPEGALAAVGLALTALDPAGLAFDFLAPKRPPAPRDHRRVRRLAAVAAALALLLGVLGLRAHWIRQRERVRADLQAQVTLASKNLAGFRQVRAQARTLNDWVAASRNWLDHLTLLSTLLPPSRDLYLTAVSTSARNSLSLSARLRSGEIIDRLGTDLKAAGYSVKPPGITPVNDRYGYRFQASLEIEVPRTITNNLDQLVVESRPPRGTPDSPAATPAPPNPGTAAAPAPASATTAPPPAPPAPPPPSPAARIDDRPADPAAARSDGPGSGSGNPEERPTRRFRRRPEGAPRE